MIQKKYKVVVVDDALLMRKVVSDILTESGKFEVIGTASDGRSGLKLIEKLKPDVVTLDVEMPFMDGVECLKEVMKACPTPAIMISSITYEGGFKAMQALDAGAFDYVQKPKAQFSSSLKKVSEDIIKKAQAAVESGYIKKFLKKTAIGSGSNRKLENIKSAQGSASITSLMPPKLAKVLSFKDYVIVIGISTGGPPCVTDIFANLPENSPPVLVVQHMPENFTKAFAERVNAQSKMNVKEAEHGDIVERGKGFIAPGHSHMELFRDLQGQLKVKLSKKPNVSGHRPSADVLFENAAKHCGKKTIGVIMTGMGRDGATQLKVLKDLGAHTIAQDQESCVVYGMPKMAILEDAADEVLSLTNIIERLKGIASK